MPSYRDVPINQLLWQWYALIVVWWVMLALVRVGWLVSWLVYGLLVLQMLHGGYSRQPGTKFWVLLYWFVQRHAFGDSSLLAQRVHLF